MEIVKEQLGSLLGDDITKMFEYEHKLSDRVPKEWIKNYKEIYYYLKELQSSGEIPVHPDFLGGNELATSIYKKKYFLKDLTNKLIEEKPEDVFVRLSSFLSAVEPDLENAKRTAKEYYLDLYEGHYLPGGRVIAGAGDIYRMKTLANCFVSQIKKDNIESIYDAAYQAARTYSYGGGIGIDITPLRPQGSVVHNAADTSTGAVSFMEIYSLTTGLIGQSGRRGALMLTIEVKHPDILHFITVKQTPNWVTNQIVNYLKWGGKFKDENLEEVKKVVMENTQVRFANISIKVTDEFMQALIEENKYPNHFLVYKKLIKGKEMEAPQSETNHYSITMPKKDISKYELLGKFENIIELNQFLKENFDILIEEKELSDSRKRDIYGDYIIETDKEYELAIKSSGDFLVYFSSKESGSHKELVKARTIWNKFIEGNYQTAEPGLIFWDRITNYSPSNYVGRPIISTNPCGEVPLEDGGACNLGSINLSRFVKHPFTEKASVDFKRLSKSVEHLTRFMDNVVEWNTKLNPLESQRTASLETRRVGLGVMGIADMFLQLQLGYDSKKATEILEEVMKFIANKAYETSSKLSLEKGKSPIFDYDNYSKCPFFIESIDENTKKLIKKNGLRNIAILSIAPTGTLSNVAVSYKLNDKNYIGISGGIEPIFALYYTRRSESFGNKMFRVFHSTVQAYLDQKGLTKEAQEAKTAPQLQELLPEHFFRTAHFIEPKIRIKIQGIAQKYIDHSISSTLNLPEDIHPEVISDIYIEAWKSGLKGVTIYRDGSRYPILSTEKEKTEFEKTKNKKLKLKLKNGKEYLVKGDEIIVLPNKKLTTPYHAIKEGLFKI